MSVKTWVALVRGINVGRNKRVAMADLRSVLESLGFHDVRTHLQSGNAFFTTERGRARDLERQIESRIQSELGLDVSVMVRTTAELAAVVDANPFDRQGADPKQLQVAFLSGKPPAKKTEGLDPDEYAPDEFALGDRVIYLRLPNGVMGSRLPDWERLLGLRATTRGWNTVTTLRDLAEG